MVPAPTMRRNVEAVIFDLDGTLLDTLRDIAEAMNAVLRAHELPTHQVSEYARMVGWGLRALVERAVPDGSTVDVNALAKELHEAYHANPHGYAQPYPGVVSVLTKLRQIGMPMAVLSNKAHSLCGIIVEATIGADWFSAIEGRRDGRPAKPDPAAALDLAGRMSADPASTVFVGDSAVDIQTAQNAGMAAIGVAWGFRTVAELEEAGAAAIIHEPGELLALVDAADRKPNQAIGEDNG